MKIFLALFLLLSFLPPVLAQELTGRIVDSLDLKPMEYVSISLFSEDNKLQNGVLSDSMGTFHFKQIKSGRYHLSAEFVGYRKVWIHDASVTKSNSLDLGSILLPPSQDLLHEILVRGKQDDHLNMIDKQVFKAEQFHSARGGTALDVLKNTPSVTVNIEGEIRFRGSTGFLLLLNGKPVITDALTVLSQIPANAVENIELLTAPSAKYDADGKAGIINIVIKKGIDDGWTGTVNGLVGLPSVDTYNNIENPKRYGGDFSLNYKKQEWDISLGGSYQQNDLAGERIGDVNTTIGNRFTSFPSKGERSFQRRNYSSRAVIVYAPNKRNSFNIGFYHGQRRQFRRADITYHSTKSDLSTGSILHDFEYFNANLVKKQGNFSVANLDYTHTFSNKTTLAISGLYEYAVIDSYTKNLNTSIQDRNDTIEYVVNTGNSPLHGFRGRVDYALPIGKGKLENGYQYRHQSQTGEYLYQRAVLGTSSYSTYPDFSDRIAIQNRIQSLYSQYSAKRGKLDYAAGLRYERAIRVFSADKLAEDYQLNLSNLFPSLNALYLIANGWKGKAGLSSRIQRSTNNELNPYPEREHSETLEQGDPNIKPEFVYLSEIGGIKDFHAGSTFFTLYNQLTQNVVNRVNSVYNDTVLNRIYTNAGNATQWGLEAGLNLKPIKWWTLYAGGNLYHYRIKGSLFNEAVVVNNSAAAYSFTVNQTFSIGKATSVQLNFNYLSERPTAIGEDGPFISPNASIKKSFWKGHFSLLLQWQNIGLGFIPSNEQRITTTGEDFYTTTNYVQEKDVLILNFIYNVNQSNKKVRLPSSEFGEKEF